jgi:hypothetical protein
VLTWDDCFFCGGGADEEVSSVTAGSSAVGLSYSPLTSVLSWVLAPDDIFLFFSSDVLSLDFLEESDIGFPFSTSIEMEVGEFVARACIN